MQGYHLWNIGTAEGGTVTPLLDDCTALMSFQGIPQKIRISYGKGRVEMPGSLGKVVSLRLIRVPLCPAVDDLVSWEKADLRRGGQEDDHSWHHRTQDWCQSMQDLLDKDPGLYFGVQDHDRVVVKEGLFYLAQDAYPGTLAVLDSPVYQKLFSDSETRKEIVREQHDMGEHQGCDHQ